MLKFLYNGIKGSDGKLQRCHYNMGGYINLPDDTITIYAKDYEPFSKEISESLNVTNDSDSQSDYFVKDRIVILVNHPLYNDVKNGYERYIKRLTNRKSILP